MERGRRGGIVPGRNRPGPRKFVSCQDYLSPDQRVRRRRARAPTLALAFRVPAIRARLCPGRVWPWNPPLYRRDRRGPPTGGLGLETPRLEASRLIPASPPLPRVSFAYPLRSLSRCSLPRTQWIQRRGRRPGLTS